MKKCFLATVEIEIPVWAENAEEAKHIAHHEALRDEINNIRPEDFEASPIRYIPNGYDDPKDYLVYGGERNMTLADALQQTPEYQQSLHKLKETLHKLKNMGSGQL